MYEEKPGKTHKKLNEKEQENAYTMRIVFACQVKIQSNNGGETS
jgi:hypothetical protein